MFQHDPQHTGRSPYIGPETPEVKWILETEEEGTSSSVIGPDGTIYFCEGKHDGSRDTVGYLYALNPDGAVKWRFQLGAIAGVTAPAIGADSTIYIHRTTPENIFGQSAFLAINSDGTLKWMQESAELFTGQPPSPVIAADGTIYVPFDEICLYAFSPEGDTEWIFVSPSMSSIASSPALGPDGTIYVTDCAYRLYAIDSLGSLKWQYNFPASGGAYASPSVGIDGTIYITDYDSSLCAFNPDGTLKWVCAICPYGNIMSTPAIGDDGTIYCVGWSWEDFGFFYAINPDGSIKWTYSHDTRTSNASLIIGGDGTIYMRKKSTMFGGAAIFAVNPDGTEKWIWEDHIGPPSGNLNPSCSIGPDGTLYVTSAYDEFNGFGINGIYALNATPPIPFSLISPPDSTVLPIARPSFIWEASFDSGSGFKDYEIYIDDALRDTVVDTFWTADYDLAEGWHDWHIVAYDSASNPRQSTETWSVLVDTTAPSVVALISPPDGVYLNDSTVDFIWYQSTDNLSGVDHYVLQYAPDSGFSSGVVETTLVDTTYYWEVKAVDAATNESEWSLVWDFEIDTEAPSAPTLVSPIGGIYLSDTMVAFEWTEVLGSLGGPGLGDSRLSPIKYVLQVDTSISFLDPVAVDTVTSAYDTLNLSEGDLFWKVKAYDLGGNESPFSDPDSFGVDITAPVIESTTVWLDTSYTGPFEILTKVTDDLAGVDSVFLYYRRDEDPGWVSVVMNASGPPDWYVDSIPLVSNPNDTVRYYIEATDLSQPANISTDPDGAPVDYYWFVANVVGIEEARTIPGGFSFGLKGNPARGRVVFSLAVPEPGEVALRIYDIAGRLIDKPIVGRKSPGTYEVLWTSNVGSGVYFYLLESPWEKRTGKLVLIR